MNTDKNTSGFARRKSLLTRQIARNPRYWPTLGLSFFIIVLDQLSKNWIMYGIRLPEKPFRHIDISGIFDLTFVQNRGVSFGLLAGGLPSRILLSSLSIAVAVFLTIWLARQRRAFTATGIGLIIGGALGNAIDRIAYGWVIDFLDFSGAYFPWVFNVADMAINVGVGCLIIDAILHYRRKNAPNGDRR